MIPVTNTSTSSKIEVDNVVCMNKNICLYDTLDKDQLPPVRLETSSSSFSMVSFSEDPTGILMSEVETSPTNIASTKINRNPTVKPEKKSSICMTTDSSPDGLSEASVAQPHSARRTPALSTGLSEASVAQPHSARVSEVRYISKERLDELEFIEQNVQSILNCAVDEYKFAQVLKSNKKKTSNSTVKR